MLLLPDLQTSVFSLVQLHIDDGGLCVHVWEVLSVGEGQVTGESRNEGGMLRVSTGYSYWWLGRSIWESYKPTKYLVFQLVYVGDCDHSIARIYIGACVCVYCNVLFNISSYPCISPPGFYWMLYCYILTEYPTPENFQVLGVGGGGVRGTDSTLRYIHVCMVQVCNVMCTYALLCVWMYVMWIYILYVWMYALHLAPQKLITGVCNSHRMSIT